MKKRMLSWLMILVLSWTQCISVNAEEDTTNMTGTDKISSVEEEWTVDNFVFDLYRANLYLETGSVCNNSITYLKCFDLPSARIVSLLDNNETFQDSVVGWKAANMVVDTSEITSELLDQKGYYEAIIFSAFLAEQQDEKNIGDIAEQISAETNQCVSSVEKWAKTESDLNITESLMECNWASLTIGEQQKINEKLSLEFMKKYPYLDDISMVSDVIDVLCETTSTLYDAIMDMASYFQILQISENMKNVINIMYEQCPNGILKSALFEVSSAMRSVNMALDVSIYNVTEQGVTKVIGKALGDFMYAAISVCPYSKAFMVGAEIGTFIGKSVSNTLFSTDKTIEMYEKMRCLGEFSDCIKQAIETMEEVYTSNKTIENANNYFASLDVYYQVADMSCDFAKNYGEVIYEDALVGKVMGNTESYDEYCQSIDFIKSTECSEHQQLLELVYASLEGKYPAIYQMLTEKSVENIVPVTGIHFNKSSVQWGMKDNPLFFGQEAVVEPESASNQEVIYTSSDESVLSIPDESKLLVSLHSTGTVTITARTVDGNYEAQLKVGIVSGYGTDGNYIEPIDEEISRPAVGAYITKNNITYKVRKDKEVWVYKGIADSVGHIEIPESISYGNYEFSVTGIEDGGTRGAGAAYGAFSNNGTYGNGTTMLKSITIPNSITYIGSYAFVYCRSLKEVQIPYSVTGFGYAVFWYADNLTVICHQDSAGEQYITETGKYGAAHGGSYGSGINKHYIPYQITEHIYESEITKVPTNGELGIRTYTCTICGAMKEEILQKGDCNIDSEVNLKDLMLCLNHVSKKSTLEGDAFAMADIDDNGTVEVKDLMRILNYVSKKSTTL